MIGSGSYTITITTARITHRDVDAVIFDGINQVFVSCIAAEVNIGADQSVF